MSAPHEAVATAFLRALARGAWADAAALTALAVPPDTTVDAFLHDLWTRLVVQYGPVQAGRLAASTPHGAGHAVDVAVRLETANVTLRVVVGAGARVTGFWITPPRRSASAGHDGA